MGAPQTEANFDFGLTICVVCWRRQNLKLHPLLIRIRVSAISNERHQSANPQCTNFTLFLGTEQVGIGCVAICIDGLRPYSNQSSVPGKRMNATDL